jgi:hypothetical protein
MRLASSPARAITSKRIYAMSKIDIAAQPALGQYRRDISCTRARTFTRGIDDHARQPRRQRQFVELAAFVGVGPAHRWRQVH